MAATAILDIDGTLVDTNYHHALAWSRAFRQHGHVVPVWQIHRHIGMGGDQLVAALLSPAAEEADGESIRTAEKALYLALIDEVAPLRGARELLEDLHDASTKAQEVEHYIELLDARGLATAWTTSADVEATKPEPDLVLAALEKTEGDDGAVMVGDSIWDFEAAGRAGIDGVAVLTGGFSSQELREAGATQVFESIDDLRGVLDDLWPASA